MGLFSGLKKLGKAIEKPFRTGRTAALRSAEQAAQAQSEAITEASQAAQDLSREFLDLSKPAFQQGTSGLAGLAQTGEVGGLGDLFLELQDSPIVDALAGIRSDAAEQALASSGLRRSGAAIQSAADVPTEALLGLLNQIIGSRRDTASIGLGQGGNVLGSIGGIVSGIGERASGLKGIAQAQQDRAQSNVDLLGGALQGVGKALPAIKAGVGKILPSIAGFFTSDVRAKENIVKMGELQNGLGVYRYNYVGDDQKHIGLLAQEVERVAPWAVIENHGLKQVNYEAAING